MDLKKVIILTTASIIFLHLAWSQATTTSEFTNWATINAGISLDSSNSLHAALQHRWFHNRTGSGHWLGALFWQRKFERFDLSGGLLTLDIYEPAIPEGETQHNIEWRPFVKIKSSTLNQQLNYGWQLGLRFLPFDGSNFILTDKLLAVRYRGLLEFKPRQLQQPVLPVGVAFKLEPMFSTSESNTLPPFDQLRSSCIVNRQLNARTKISLSYMHWLVQPVQQVFQHRHTITTALSLRW